MTLSTVLHTILKCDLYYHDKYTAIYQKLDNKSLSIDLLSQKGIKVHYKSCYVTSGIGETRYIQMDKGY